MELKLIEDTGAKIGLQIEKEDFSIPSIIHEELLKDSRLVFAAVVQIHPILKRYVIKVESKKQSNPVKVLTDASGEAVKNTEALLKEARRAFEGKGK